MNSTSLTSLFGLLNVYKPAGLTSRDCVNQIQRIVHPMKVGHAGTLDPIAEGVLLIAVGDAVRLIDWLHLLPKTYKGLFRLGVTSPSADDQSEITELQSSPIPTLEELQFAAAQFQGAIQQQPPIYSAVRIDGKRAYERARDGESIEMPLRDVQVHEIAVSQYEYPIFGLHIECGTGTYVRSLGRDIARRLNSDAIMFQLNRTAIGPFAMESAIQAESLDTVDSIRDALINPVNGLPGLAKMIPDSQQLTAILQGKSIELSVSKATIDAAELAIVDEHGKLLSIMKLRTVQGKNSIWSAKRNFKSGS